MYMHVCQATYMCIHTHKPVRHIVRLITDLSLYLLLAASSLLVLSGEFFNAFMEALYLLVDLPLGSLQLLYLLLILIHLLL